MIEICTETDGSLITGEITGEISEADVKALGAAMDDCINTHDRIPSLMVYAKKFPRYESLGVLKDHLKVVREHEKIVPRVALVSDGVLLRIAEPVLKMFVKAEVRHFFEEDIDEAREWARNGEPVANSLKILDGFPNDVLAMEVSGRLRGADFEEVLDPLIAKKLERHDKLKVLLVVGDDFEGATSGAAWDDMKLGLNYFTKYSKLAVVTDLHWLRNSVRLMGPFMPAKVQTYPLFKKDLAEDWIKT